MSEKENEQQEIKAMEDATDVTLDDSQQEEGVKSEFPKEEVTHQAETQEFDDEAATDDETDQGSEGSETIQSQKGESGFLQEWRKRHEHYLQQQLAEETLVPKEDSESKKGKQTKKGRFTPKEKKKKPGKPPLARTAVLKSLPLFVVAVFFLLLSLYFITPLGTRKDFVVKGNQHVTSETILKSSRISRRDYLFTTFLQAKDHAANIKKSNPWIESARLGFALPWQVTIEVKEYSQMGYIKQGEAYYPVLSNGEISETPTASDALSDQLMVIELSDRELIQKLVAQLKQVDQKILSSIQVVRLTPSRATNDLLTLDMRGGNQVLVPLSEIEFKVPYYTNIAQQLMVPSTIDMEVGIYSYPKGE